QARCTKYRQDCCGSVSRRIVGRRRGSFGRRAWIRANRRGYFARCAKSGSSHPGRLDSYGAPAEQRDRAVLLNVDRQCHLATSRWGGWLLAGVARNGGPSDNVIAVAGTASRTQLRFNLWVDSNGLSARLARQRSEHALLRQAGDSIRTVAQE